MLFILIATLIATQKYIFLRNAYSQSTLKACRPYNGP